MSDESGSDVKEVAKAVQETAVLGQRALDTVNNTAAFVDRLFGDLVIDGVGLLADKLKFYRLDRYLEMERKVREKHQRQGVTETRPVSPKVALPLLEYATLEDNDALHTRWSNLLSNAMDPAYDGNVNKNLVSILAELEPLDAQLLQTMVDAYEFGNRSLDQLFFDKAIIVEILGQSPEQVEFSLLNLLRLGCVKPGVVGAADATIGSHQLTSIKARPKFT